MLAIVSLREYIHSTVKEVGSMKKTLTILCISLSALMILDSMNAGHALVMFFLAGVIPGTNVAIDAARMLELFTLLIGFTLSRITMSLMRIGNMRPHLTYQSS